MRSFRQRINRITLFVICLLVMVVGRHIHDFKIAQPVPNVPAGATATSFQPRANGEIASGGVAELVPTAPPSAAPAEQKPCPDGTIEITGSYCTDLTHWCKAGYEKIGGPWMNYEGPGVPGVEYCEKFVVGKAVCNGPEKPMHFCIDKYEFPNVAGETPQVLVSWHEAKASCESRGERLCDDDEWTLACEGPERTPYPYGWERDESVCNLNRPIPQDVNRKLFADTHSATSAAELKRVSLLEPSGSMPLCTSPYGVSDMTGNGDELCNNVTTNGRPFASVLKGGHWMGKMRNRCRPGTFHHDTHYRDFVQGYRCCKNAATEPNKDTGP